MADDKKTDDKKKAAPNRDAIFAKARAMILKTTGSKPLQPGATTMGHISTGSFPVDMLIGGTPAKDGKGPICPGFPRRRITELYGPESSGKTTLLISAMVQAQKAGGAAMFIDFEHSLDHNYAKALGLDYDVNKLLVLQPDSMEDGFKQMYIGILTGFDIIGVDSVAAMVPKDELIKGFDDAAKIGAVARQFSMVLPKFVTWLQKHPMVPGEKEKSDPSHPGTALVFINQTRALIQTSGGGHGGDENTSGGKALKFYAYLRMRSSRIKSEFIERKDTMTGKKRRFPYGNVTDVKIVKSKVDAKQGHSTQIFIRYGVGIDDYYSVIETGVVHKVIRRDGAYYTLKDARFQGKDKLRKYLIENPKVYDTLRTQLAQSVNAAAVDAGDDIGEDDELLEGFDLDDSSAAGSVEEVSEEVVSIEDEVNAE
jgi:recombination protein RecA